MNLKIEETNEAGETVADLSPEPRMRRGRMQPEERTPTDANLPKVGDDVWLSLPGGKWEDQPRKVIGVGVTSSGDAFRVGGFENVDNGPWLLMRHEKIYWSRTSCPGDECVAAAELARHFSAAQELASSPHVPLVSGGGISANSEERTGTIPDIDPPAPTGQKTLAYTVRRHKSLDEAIKLHCGRPLTWEVFGAGLEIIPELASRVLEAWNELGATLDMAVNSKASVKVTARSKMRLWLRPGARVRLSERVVSDYLEVYDKEQLDSLYVSKVLASKAMVYTAGGVNLGLVDVNDIEPHQPR